MNLQEQRGKHTYIPQRASLPPQGRPGARTQERDYPYPPQYTVRTPTAHRPVPDDLEDDESYYPVRPSSSAIRYTTTQDQQVITNGNKRIVIHHGLPPPSQAPQQHVQAEPEAHRTHWLLYVGITILLMLVGWVLVSLLLQWWQITQDDLRYGRPRTYQVDQRVGHGDSRIPSHFIAMNLNHRVQIIECPASDCSKAVIYVGAEIIGDGQDLVIVTLTFKDVNGDGKLDMLVHVADQTYVYINDTGRFRPARPDEHVSV